SWADGRVDFRDSRWPLFGALRGRPLGATSSAIRTDPMIKAGDKLPNIPIRLVDAAGTTETDTNAVLGQGLVVLFAVPGAFTPPCDTSHLPGFVANAGKLKAFGVDRIVCACANDHHVVRAWAERSDALDRIDFIADPRAEFADAMGLGKEFSDLGHR